MFAPRNVRWIGILLLLAACSPRLPIQVNADLTKGSTLSYNFHADVRTKLIQGSEDSVESTLEGLVTLTILEESDAGLLMEIRVAPSASSRDGVETNPGPAEERTVLLLPEGGVVSDPGANGKLGDADLDPDALATLLRPSVPSETLKLGDRWRIGKIAGRLLSLVRRDNQDLAQLQLAGSRDVSIQRTLEGQPIELVGVENAETDLLWDLELGAPSSATIRSEASLEVRAGAQSGGVITIVARTTFKAI